MLTRHRRSAAIACILFCAQALLFSKCGLGQVGITWDPSYAAADCGNEACGGRALGLCRLGRDRYNPLDFDPSDPNDEQRRILFEYYNANRCQTYSADGVAGWDTSCTLNPLYNAARRRQSAHNLASCLGAGTMHVDPFLKRVYGAAQPSPDSPKTMSSPLTPQTEPEPNGTPATKNASDGLPPLTYDDPNPIVDLTEDITKESAEDFPTPEEYEDVAPEFEWDESLLEELPELNHGTGNTSRKKKTDRLSSIGGINPLQAAIRLQSATQESRPPANQLQAAIKLQSTPQKKRRPINALQAAIAIEHAEASNHPVGGRAN